MYDIPCVIFAGGKSSRMGEDKSLLPFGEKDTITQFQYFRLKKIFKTVYISCKSKDKFDFKANFIEDIKTNNTFAPTIGFISVFAKLKVNKFFTISVDSPFISKNEIEKIISLDTKKQDATIAKTKNGMQPLCGIYHKSLENKFLDMLKNDEHKLGFLLKSSNTTFVKFEDDKAFMNLNYKNEYLEALKISKKI